MGCGESKPAAIGPEVSSKGKADTKLSVGTFKEQYEMQAELGSGAHSVVRLALHKGTKALRAVKIIQTKGLSPEDISAIDQEIDILNMVDHPNIIKLYEKFRGENEYYIVTELVQGGELFDRIVNKMHYSELEARDLIKLFISTMHYLHSNNICHRDLKPENLLLVSEDDDSDLKIADFGYAKHITKLHKEQPCGTPGYVAPEILRGDEYGAEVDIWSMGVICYVLLAGYPPFYDDDTKKLYRKIKLGNYQFHHEHWDQVSDDAKDLIRKMLTVDQKKRWTAEQLLKHPWITHDSQVLSTRGLDNTIVNLKKFNARKKFRAAAQAVIASNRIGAIFSARDPTNQRIIGHLSTSFSGRTKSTLDLTGEEGTFDGLHVEGDNGVAAIVQLDDVAEEQ